MINCSQILFRLGRIQCSLFCIRSNAWSFLGSWGSHCGFRFERFFWHRLCRLHSSWRMWVMSLRGEWSGCWFKSWCNNPWLIMFSNPLTFSRRVAWSRCFKIFCGHSASLHQVTGFLARNNMQKCTTFTPGLKSFGTKISPYLSFVCSHFGCALISAFEDTWTLGSVFPTLRMHSNMPCLKQWRYLVRFTRCTWCMREANNTMCHWVMMRRKK